jgi:hypothetical protein
MPTLETVARADAVPDAESDDFGLIESEEEESPEDRRIRGPVEIRPWKRKWYPATIITSSRGNGEPWLYEVLMGANVFRLYQNDVRPRVDADRAEAG